jgi:hypothetical protein
MLVMTTIPPSPNETLVSTNRAPETGGVVVVVSSAGALVVVPAMLVAVSDATVVVGSESVVVVVAVSPAVPQAATIRVSTAKVD